MRRIAGWLVCLVVGVASIPTAAKADQFEWLDGPTLNRSLKSPDLTPHPTLSVGDLGAMPSVLRDSRSALIVVRTDLGNLSRLLIVPELRKPPGSAGEPIPVLVVERLDTFGSGDLATRFTSRRDIVLFDAMPIDLDTGQVVPPGQGGDLVFRISGGEPRLEAVLPAQLFTFKVAPTFDEPAIPRPSPGRSILAGDFAGRYRLFANGQWSGTLDLKVEGRGVITGRFRSDLHGTTYPVTGQVVADAPGKIRFAVALPRARQEFDGYLFGEGKAAIAGTLSLLDRTFGFFAVREGGRYAPETRDLGPLQAVDHDRPGRITLDLSANGVASLDGKPIALDKLAEALGPIAEPVPWVLIRASDDAKFSTLVPIIEAIRASTMSTIRFEFLGKSAADQQGQRTR